MGTAAPPLTAPGAAPRLGLWWIRSFIVREGMLIGTAAFFVAFWSFAAPDALVADSWLTLLGGHEIVAHGIPHHDSLAIVTHGRPWIDQQWLAQLAYWGTYRVGGLRLDLLLTILLELAALVLAFVFARRRGASGTSIAPLAIVPFFYFWSVMRAQVFSNVLFVVVLGLLAAESRRPSRRVWLVFPLLVLWANVHGAVVVGVALTALLGACEGLAALRARSRALLRPALLVSLPWLALLATPWGLGIVPYYRSTLANPLFREFQTEWMQPRFLSVLGCSFYLLAGVAIALVARRGSDLTVFELGALGLTLVGALAAVRSAPWFGYACVMLLPALRERSRRGSHGSSARLRVVFALTLLAAAVVASTVSAARPVSRDWPAAAASAVDRVLRSDPNARVFSSHEYADWLLFTKPSTRGRIAFDGRWEILTQPQTKQIVEYLWQTGTTWERPARGYRIVVLDTHDQPQVVKTYDARRYRVLYRGRSVVVYDRATTTLASR